MKHDCLQLSGKRHPPERLRSMGGFGQETDGALGGTIRTAVVFASTFVDGLGRALSVSPCPDLLS